MNFIYCVIEFEPFHETTLQKVLQKYSR